MWRYRCDITESRNISLDVKGLFGNLSLVRAPAFFFQLEPEGKVIHLITQSKNGDFNLRREFSSPSKIDWSFKEN